MSADFEPTFRALRAILSRHAPPLIVQVDTATEYQLASPTHKDRIGRPLFVAAVQVKKTYVTYHLIPVYAVPSLVKGMSAGLKKRMQGKACFNFVTVDDAALRELTALTAAAIGAAKTLSLPWEQQKAASRRPPHSR